MKSFACVLLIVAVAAAEPQWYRQNYRFARQETGDQEPTTARTDDAPYPAAGFRPEVEFKLPNQEQIAPPATTYGVPDSSFGAPAFEYGPPESPSTEAPEQSEPTTETLEVAGLTKEKIEEAPKQETEVISNQGVYYVLLPGSQLQRVQFQTENDLRNMAYTARLQYKTEERAPLYVYTAVPQYQTSAALVQVSGALVQPTVSYQTSGSYALPAVEYGKPPVAYTQAW